jgi:hypothetical protein
MGICGRLWRSEGEIPGFLRVYTGDDGQSHIEELDFEMRPFVDTGSAHGTSAPIINTLGVAFREYQPDYFLDYLIAPADSTT